MKHLLPVAAAVVLTAASCNDNLWNVGGTIAGGEGKTIVLEASHNGNWYPLDSVILDASGKFDMATAPSGYPDIYRLRIGEQSVYFPIDSIESVTVTGSAGAFATDYTLSGSVSADALFDVDKKISAVVRERGEGAVATDSLLKRELAGMLLGDPSGVVAYYIINKKVGATPIFNPADKKDLKIIGAVANAFVQYRPADPRTAYLSSLFLTHRQRSVHAVDTIAVAETPLIDFMLKDENGSQRTLSEIASHGKVVLLNFTVYGAERSPEYNRQLAAIYTSLHDAGLDIVQVAIDDNQFDWVKSAKNLPWITLYAPEHKRAGILLGYNVGNIPATFIIDRKGDLVERVDDLSEIRAAVNRYL